MHLLELGGMQKRIQGSLFGMCSPPPDILRQIDLYRAGKLRLDELVTRRYTLDESTTPSTTSWPGATSAASSSTTAETLTWQAIPRRAMNPPTRSRAG